MQQYTHTHDLCSTGPWPPGLNRPAQYLLRKPVPLRPDKPGIHTCSSSALPAPPPGLHWPAPSPLFWAMPPRPVMLEIHTRTISVLLGRAPQFCTGLHNLCSAWPCPQGLPSCKPQTFMISAGTHPQACTGLPHLHWAVPLMPA
jgi:hypothetical protein